MAIPKPRFGTRLAHATEIDVRTGAVTPGLSPSTTFRRDASYSSEGAIYARDDAPDHRPVERLLADLDGGHDALLFGSGMAAATAVFCTLAVGDHVVVQSEIYFGLRTWLATQATRAGLDLRWVDPTDNEALAAAILPGRTRLLWIETPANPRWTIIDIARCAAVAHAAGALLAVDGTAATPILQRPIQWGADLVIHSATKALNGHGDVVAGLVITASDGAHWQAIRRWRHDAGGILGPFEAWLLLRGLRTLELRVRRATETAAWLADELQFHPQLCAVLYPGLAEFPGHAIAARQMDGFGSMLSIRVRGGADAALQVAARLSLWTRATSLGGFESLVEHRASVEGPGSFATEDLLRLSVGLEEREDLLADLQAALASLIPVLALAATIGSG